ncbi:MAG: endonuclease/exonuclease/phosphatase family protein [Candidatus Eremiobacteraeota bacterium]|nr:endonuclease/exonuclease/phosphatase family protein [Candidatus Eremiobacteraeota bacterium]
MRILLPLILLVLSGCTPREVAQAQTPESTVVAGAPADSSYYRLASWNVRNLFDDVDDPYRDETPSTEEYQSKLRELAKVIGEVDADFIALQEVENLASLSEVNSLLGNPYPQVGLLEGNDQIRGIDVAFLSRLPVKEVVSHASLDLPLQDGDPQVHHFSRDCLEVRLDTEPSVVVLVNHFKSARGDSKKSARKRRAQAEGVLQVAEAIPSEEALFVVGDLNGRQDEWSLEPLFQRFQDPFAGLPPETRITHRYRHGGSALDHILLDPEAAQIASNARIWSEIAKDTSDHNPVSVELLISPAKEAAKRVWAESR